MILKRVGFLTLGYAMGIFSAITAFFGTLVSLLQARIPEVAQTIDPTVLAAIDRFGWLALLMAPISGLIMGFLGGVITAAIYNWIVVKLTGGIKLDLSEAKKK